jgi:predicted DNA-binding protein (UPF0251 family)
MPGVTYFKPAGIPMRMLNEICLPVEEAEAIRLKDLEDLDQEQCAERMNISRPTFQRVLESARKKIAEALLEGKAIRIEGGNFEMAAIRYRCRNSHEWDVPLAKEQAEAAQPCPICGTTAMLIVSTAVGWRGGNGRGRWCGGR